MSRNTNINGRSSSSGSSGSGSNTTSTRGRGSSGRADNPSNTSSTTPNDVSIDDIYDNLFNSTDPTDLRENLGDYKHEGGASVIEKIFAALYGHAFDGSDRMQILQLLLQTLLTEQSYQRDYAYSELNYERSLAKNQVNQMQAAGMSRAAALAALQGGSSPQSVSPAGNITPFSPTDGLSPVLQGINNANGIVQSMCASILNMSNFDIDKRSKLLTNQLLQHQSTLLGSQIQGINDAALFQQAIANAPDFVREMSPYEQYGYFMHAATLKAGEDGFDPSSFYFGQSPEFKRCAQNPYFWNALSSSSQEANKAYASVFEPQKAQAFIQQQRALTELTNRQSSTEKQRARILTSQAFIDECTATCRRDMEICKAECLKLGYQFDANKAERFLERVSNFTDYDIESIQYQLKRLRYISSPDVFEQEKAEIINSLDYNVYQYMYGTAIASMKYGELQKYMDDGDNAIGDAQDWIQDYFRYQEFGGSAATSSLTDIWRTGFTGLTSVGALAFGGAKLYQAYQKSKSVVSAAAAGAPPVPFNGIVPLVVPNTPVYNQQMQDLWIRKGIDSGQLFQ